MFRVMPLVQRFGELHDGVGAAGPRVAVTAVQAGAPQPGLARKYVDAVVAESLFDVLAVELQGLGCAGTEYGGEHTWREVRMTHAGDWRNEVGEQYTLGLGP